MNRSRIIVALDYPNVEEAERFVKRVQPEQCRLKLGLELYTAAGPDFVRALIGRGFDVFLDLKFHDIPTTVARACQSAATLGVWMLNVHCLGGAEMLRAARAAIEATGPRPVLLGVTILTSHTERDLAELGLRDSIEANVARLARTAHDSGLDGVVCSAREAAALRARFGAGFVLVTPGIRPAGAESNDQARAVTPREAARSGADYLVIGRPVTRAADPLAALEAIRRELEED